MRIEAAGREFFETGEALANDLHGIAIHDLIVARPFLENVVERFLDRIEGIEKVFRSAERAAYVIGIKQILFHLGKVCPRAAFLATEKSLKLV